ncbi:MAG: DUF4382 domain-containing protein [Cyclobacteriaceae bacterium]|nr:DUF4382 domain-containing protein [Cyclobacteriaceae bacterium]
MKTTFLKLGASLALVSALILTQSCSDSDNKSGVGNGEAEFQITDAPTDDADVKGVFVTVTDVKVDGVSVSGFTKQTIDLKAYSEGTTKLLATSNLAAKSYSNLTLVIDSDFDASGTAPGSYVLTNDNVKYKLRDSGTIDITLNNTWKVSANTKSTIILDFDIRKAIRKVDNAAVRYNFVSNDNLKASVRVVSQSDAATINGNYTEQVNTNADKLFVYAYKKGTFDAGVEGQPQGDDKILFKNAVTSAEVKGTLNAKTYKLAFVEAGEYELHFASYDVDSNDDVNLQALLTSTITLGASSPNIVTIQGGVNMNVTTSVTAIN